MWKMMCLVASLTNLMKTGQVLTSAFSLPKRVHCVPGMEGFHRRTGMEEDRSGTTKKEDRQEMVIMGMSYLQRQRDALMKDCRHWEEICGGLKAKVIFQDKESKRVCRTLWYLKEETLYWNAILEEIESERNVFDFIDFIYSGRRGRRRTLSS